MGKPFHPCPMFVGKNRSLPNRSTFQLLHYRALQTNITLGFSRDKCSNLLRKIVNYGRKKFCNICAHLGEVADVGEEHGHVLVALDEQLAESGQSIICSFS